MGTAGQIFAFSGILRSAELIATVAAIPGARILNSADPDTPAAKQIVQTIGTRLDWPGTLNLLESGTGPERGRHPWLSTYPIVLDTKASAKLGYVPVGNGLDLLHDEIDWVAAQHRTH